MQNLNPNPAPINGVPTADQIAGAILSDYVYHLADSASKLPTGWVALTTGANKTPLVQYNAASGDYAEVYEKPKLDDSGAIVLDTVGNPVPSEIIVVYRGTVFTSDPTQFQSTTVGQTLAGSASGDNGDSAHTIATDEQIVLGQENLSSSGSTISAVVQFDTNIKAAIVGEFGNDIKDGTPYINDGQSLGGMNATIATASALAQNNGSGDGWNVSAMTFNSPPIGVALASSGLISSNIDYSNYVNNFYAGNEVITDSYVTRSLIFIGQEVGGLFQGTTGAPFEIGTYNNLPGNIKFLDFLLSPGPTAINAHDPKSVIAGLAEAVQDAGQTEDGVSYSEVQKEIDESYAGVPLSETPQLLAIRAPGTDENASSSVSQDNTDAGAYIAASQSLLQQLPRLIANSTSQTERSYYQNLQTALQDTTGGYYVVQPGDTWTSLAAKYGVDPATLEAINVGDDPSGNLGPNLVVRTPISVTNGLPSSPNINPNLGQVGFYDLQTGKWITTLSVLNGSDAGEVEVINNSGQNLLTFDAPPVSLGLYAGTFAATVDGVGDMIVLNSNDSSVLQNSSGTTLDSFGVGQLYSVAPASATGGPLTIYTLLSTGVSGMLLNAISYNSSTGTLATLGPEFSDPAATTGSTIAQAQVAAGADKDAVSADVPAGIPSTIPVSDQYFTATVASGTTPSSSGDSSADALASGTVSNGLLFNQGNVTIATGQNAAGTNSIANTGGLADSSLSGTIDGYVRPASGQEQPSADIVGDLIAGQETGGPLSNPAPTPAYQATYSNTSVFDVQQKIDLALAGYAFEGPDLIDIDPLLVDLTGAGINLTNWLDSSVFFDTNLNSAGTAADGMEHHTSWIASGTGMLVFDPTGGAITNITQTVSEDLNVGSGVGNFKDGLAALASLAVTGATAFTATTSRIDPLTGKSYWSEIAIAQGYPSISGVIAPTQLETLAAAGITSISLQGSGNEGESIAGSPITNRSTYTYTSGGTTTTGQIAAVDFATDTTGDVTTTASGGIVVNSVPEGGASAANSYIDTSGTARSFQLSNGTLTDITDNQVLKSNVVGFFATTENDMIRVAAGDPGNYWLGGGTGAATLDASQGSGTITFLINSQTVVHGGSGFNMAQVTDGSSITVDLKTDNLQEVIGGTGDGTFNASGTTWNVFIQGGSGNNIIIGGYADDALSGGSGEDLIEGGQGGSVIHAGSGNDLIYGGSGTTAGAPNSDVIFGGAGNDTVVLGTNNSAVYAGSGSMTLIGNDNQTIAGTTTKAFSVVNFHGSYANYTLTHNADGSTTVTDNVAGQDGPVTLENVTGISFSDVSMIPLNTMGIMPANDTVVVSGSGPYVIKAPTLLANDIDYAGNTLSIASLLDNNGATIARGASGQVNGGVASLSADGSQITFTPTAGFTGLPSFRYYDQDNLGNTDINVGLSLNNTATGNSALIDATVTLVSPTDPTDPGFNSEWYLQAADVLPAWSAGFTGAGVSVGVFDPSGNVDFTNPDLTANEDGTYLDTGAPGLDQIGTHATLVAGVIGAADDGEGDVGVAYNATISSEAITTGTDTTDIVSGALADWSKYDVVNNSWGATQPFADNFDSNHNNQQDFQNAVQNGRNGLGTIIVFAAGNTRTTGGNTNNESNTDNPDEITVGGINATSDIGSLQFSGAPFSSPGATILVSAPANNITTTGVDLTNEFGQQTGGTSETALGTSLAAPIVSGVVAMMLQANPNLGYRDVQQILADTATLVPSTAVAPTTWSYNGATDWNGGGMHVSNDYGFGEVDAAAAVRLAQTWTNVSPSYNYALSPLSTDDPLSSLESYSITVPAGGAPTIQDFQVEVQLVDANPSDLTITLTSPTGVVSTLMDQPQNAAMTGTATTPDGVVHPVFEATFDSVQDLGASFAGTWTVSITGSKGASEPGDVTLVGFIPEQITPTTTHIYTDEFGSLSADPNNAARSTLTDTGAGVTLNASAVSSGMNLDLRPGSMDSVIAGRSLTIAANTTVTTVDGGAGNDKITANDAGDTIVAGLGNDTITGGAGNDTVILSGGSDAIDGGGGTNTAVFTSSNTIPDSSWAINENTIGGIVVNGTNAGFAGNATLTRIQSIGIGGSTYDLVATPTAGGTTTVSTPKDGAAGVIVADGVSNDTLTFNNIGTSYWHAGGGNDTATLAAGTTDIYLQGTASQYTISGTPTTRLTLTDQVANRNGTKTIIAGAGTGNIVFSDGSTIAVNHAEAVASDFNGDGKSDVLFQNTNGSVAIWEMNGTSVLSDPVVGTPDPSWRTVGTGDFNGDGKSDILFQNTNGSVAIWEMNGTSVLSGPVVGTPGPSWRAVGTGDFNDDGKSDILFQNTNGSVAIWEMNGTSVLSDPVVGTPDPSWRAVGTGDFNGDGKSDILFQNTNGSVAIWEMNGTSVLSDPVVGTPGPSWRAIGTGDYNGDGKSDILFQNTKGNVAIGEMNGASVTSDPVIGSPGLSWQTIGLNGMNYINATTSTGTISATPLDDNFDFSISLSGSHVITGFDPLHDVITLSQILFSSYSNVQQSETQTSGGTIINLGSGSTLTLAGVMPTSLTSHNFV